MGGWGESRAGLLLDADAGFLVDTGVQPLKPEQCLGAEIPLEALIGL